MDINVGDPPCLDQMVSQRVAKTPSDITPWSWADPLNVSLLRWTDNANGVTSERHSFPQCIPMRHVRVGPQLRTGTTGLEVSERFRAVAEMLAKPIGDFQANRFFSFPAMLDTKAVALFVEAVRSSTGSNQDEAPYLRCMLASEVLVDQEKMRKLTHVGSHIAIDSIVNEIERNMGSYGRAAPDGLMYAVDLSFFSDLMTRKTTLPAATNGSMGIDTWGNLTAVVPVKFEYSGSRGLPPYSLSFVTTAYWTQRVGYTLKLSEIGVSDSREIEAGCVPRAAQALVGGPTNILFVVIDIEVHPSDVVELDVGTQAVRVVGRKTARPPDADKRVRTVVNKWMGDPKTTGMPDGRQRDSYDALQMLNEMVGTGDVFDTALNLATELSRVFSCNATVAGSNKESCGLTCFSADVASGKKFGVGGSKAKRLGPWSDPIAISGQLDYTRFFFVAPSGMMCEGSGVVTIHVAKSWPQLDSFSCTTSSVNVSEADFAVRVARAIELVMPGRSSITPRRELSLTLWLSGNALLLSGVTFAAYLSFGLDWAMLNGLLAVTSELTTSLKKLIPVCTNQRVSNCIDSKRQLYLDGKKWTGYSNATENASTNGEARSLKDVSGFPLPMFIIRAVVGKLGVELSRPPIEGTYFDLDDSEDSQAVGVITTGQRNWIFAPLACDSIDFTRSKFQVFTNTPTGREEKEVEIGVWPRAWCDTVTSWAAQDEDVEMATRIRLMTDAVSGKFYAEGFLKRSTYTYVTSPAPSGTINGEADVDLTRPDPQMGFWQKAWTTLKGWIPGVVSETSSRTLTGTLPGAAREISQGMSGTTLDRLHKKRSEYTDPGVFGVPNPEGTSVQDSQNVRSDHHGPGPSSLNDAIALRTRSALLAPRAPLGNGDVVADSARAAGSPAAPTETPCQ